MSYGHLLWFLLYFMNPFTLLDVYVTSSLFLSNPQYLCPNFIPSLGASFLFHCLGGAVVKNPSANAETQEYGFDPWVGKISWSRKWQTAAVFLPGKFHGQRNLTGYSPRHHKESYTTKWLNAHTETHTKWPQAPTIISLKLLCPMLHLLSSFLWLGAPTVSNAILSIPTLDAP